MTLSRTVYGVGLSDRAATARGSRRLFARIERWTATGTGLMPLADDLPRDNITSLYGTDAASRVADPADPTRIFAWHSAGPGTTRATPPSTATPPRTAPGSTPPPRTRPTAPPAGRAAQIYLKPSSTATSQPYLPDWTAAGRGRACRPTGCSRSSSTTATTPRTPPTPTPDGPWTLRPDPFSIYRAGFEVRTYRRVQRLLFFHNFPDEPTAGADCLVQLARPGLLRPAGARRPAQPDLHAAGLGDPDRLPARAGRRPAHPVPARCRRCEFNYSHRRSSPPC